MLDAWKPNLLVNFCVEDHLEELRALRLHLVVFEHIFHFVAEDLSLV